MHGKKFIFILALWAVFAGADVFAADAVIYTQPYVLDGEGKMIPHGTGPDGKPRFLEHCGPCAVLDRALYERNSDGSKKRKLVDWGGTVVITDRVPSHITSVPTLVLPGRTPIEGPSAIFSNARDYAARQMAANPAPVSPPRGTVTSVKDLLPRKSDLPDTLPPVPGDKDYVPPKPPKVTNISGNDDWDVIKTPKPVRYVYSLKKGPIYVPKSGTKYEVVIERCGFDADGNETGCEEAEIIIESSLPGDTALRIAQFRVREMQAKEPAAPAVTPKPVIKPPMPVAAPKYHYTLGKPELVDGIYEIWVISRCLLDKNGNEVSCTKVTGLTLQVPKTAAPNPAKAQAMIEKYLQEKGVPPEYLPQPKAPKAETPPGVTEAPRPFKRGTVTSPESTKVSDNMRELTAQEKADLVALEKQVSKITAKYADPKLTAADRAALDKQAADLAKKISDIMNSY